MSHVWAARFLRSSTVTPACLKRDAAPEVMETEIVNPIEQAVISVQGVQDIESNMRQGTANIKLTFDTSKDIDAALQETNSKLRSVALP